MAHYNTWNLWHLLPHEMCILSTDSASVVRVVKSSDTVIEGDSFSLTCEVSGDPMPNVTWITESNDEHSYGNILSFINITRGDSGDYRCETKNSCGKESRSESINVFCKSWDVNFSLNDLMYNYYNLLTIYDCKHVD